MANSKPDENSRGTLIALSSSGDGSIVPLYANPTTHRLLVDNANTSTGLISINGDTTQAQILAQGTGILISDNGTGTHTISTTGGSGTVTSVSVVSANGLAGTVATSTTTPAITLSTTINSPVLAGNGTAILAATTTGSTSTVVLATSPTITTPTISGHFTAEGVTTTGATGTGNLVFATSPSLTTPALGVASATTINKVTITAPATGSTLTIADGKTLVASNSLTFVGTDGTSMTFPTGSAIIAGIATTQTLTNKRITKRVSALSANSATPALNTDNFDVLHITAQTTAITSFTSGLAGTPVDGDALRISVTGTTSIALTFGTSFEASTVALPTTTSGTTRLDMGFLWNTETGKWRIVAVA